MTEEIRSEDVRRFLVANSFLGGLSETHLERVLKLGVTRKVDKNETLLHQDMPDARLILILGGTVKVFRIAADGREVVLNFLKAGDALGEIAVLDGGVRSAGAIMMEKGSIFVLQRADLLPLLLENPQALLEVVESLCEKLRMMSEATEAGQLGMEGRLAAGLLRLALLHGRNTRQGVEIELPASQRDIGAYVGLSRENASRQMARLARAGVIETVGKRLVIHDLDHIRALATP